MNASTASRRIRAAVAVVAFGLTGCGGGPAAGAVTADAYVAALSEFMPPPPGADDESPVVFVVPIGETALDLDTQVAVIDAFAERWDVRFVDDPQAAIEAGRDDVARGGTANLLGIGKIHATPPHTVRVEQYSDATNPQGHRVTLVERGGTWSVDSVADVEPEVLVDDG